MGISKVEDEDLRVEYTRHTHAQLKPTIDYSKSNSEGYLGSVEKYRDVLEKLYKRNSGLSSEDT